ncbi:MAG: hypothetical protein KDC99_15380 [Cyclobacteriaceae bacterium]|nr:hypothetical protein [Cyclobacteriaceae bacterium]
MHRIIVFIVLLVTSTPVAMSQSFDELMDAYWKAETAVDREKVSKKIVGATFSVDKVYAALVKGKSYSHQRSGYVKVLQQTDPKLPPHAVVTVPEGYDPTKQYPVQIYLHGAVSNVDPFFLYRYTIDTTNTELLKADRIFIFPSGWNFAPWWSDVQSTNLHYLLNYVKENYNVDENKVRLSGVSDGGIGSYYFANCDQTYWSGVTPFIGSVRALTRVGARQLYFNNFSNVPFYIVNTNLDNIFDISWEKPFADEVRNRNPKSHYTIVKGEGHNMKWFPGLRDSINTFVQNHSRHPYPDTLIWQTENLNFGRYRYLVIDKIGKTKSDARIADPNSVDLLGTPITAFRRELPSGIIRLVKSGNSVQVEASNVKQYTILISPDHFDITQPIVVITNGTKSFEGKVNPDVSTLLKWNRKDNDRKMLFVSELTIKVN